MDITMAKAKSVKSDEVKSVRFQIGSHCVWSAPKVLDVEKTIESFTDWLEENVEALEASWSEQVPSLTADQENVAKTVTYNWFKRTKNANMSMGILIPVIAGALTDKSVEYSDPVDAIIANSLLIKSVTEWVDGLKVCAKAGEETVALNGKLFETNRGIRLIPGVLEQLRGELGL
jgi:hypothetical protein